jgi:crossover junction endodeoxyribonuclease RuvC
MIVIGIDPGLTGGVAAIDSVTRAVSVHSIPTVPLEGNGLIRRRVDGRAFGLLIRRLIPAAESGAVFLEQVGAMGGKDNAVQTQASLAGTFLGIRCVLDVLLIRPQLLQPQAWKRSFGLKRKEGETPTQFKARHLAMARGLYPDAELPRAGDHNKAEALLIAHFGLQEMS